MSGLLRRASLTYEVRQPRLIRGSTEVYGATAGATAVTTQLTGGLFLTGGRENGVTEPTPESRSAPEDASAFQRSAHVVRQGVLESQPCESEIALDGVSRETMRETNRTSGGYTPTLEV